VEQSTAAAEKPWSVPPERILPHPARFQIHKHTETLAFLYTQWVIFVVTSNFRRKDFGHLRMWQEGGVSVHDPGKRPDLFWNEGRQGGVSHKLKV